MGYRLVKTHTPHVHAHNKRVYPDTQHCFGCLVMSSCADICSALCGSMLGEMMKYNETKITRLTFTFKTFTKIQMQENPRH